MTEEYLDEIATLPGIFISTVKDCGLKVALRYKNFGIWEETTWAGYRNHVETVFHGLKSMGLQKGDVVLILSSNRPEWVYVDVACQCAGAFPLGIYADCLEPELEYALNHNSGKFIVVEDQEQADKILNIADKVPTLQKCIFIEPDGMEDYDHPILISYSELEETGRRRLSGRPTELEESISQVKPEDTAFLCTTSGTTKNPKTVMLSHKCVLKLAEALMKLDSYGPDDEEVSYLPLPWIVERFFSVIFHMKARYKVNFPETMELSVVFQNMREICPSILICAPRVWEGFCTTVYLKRDNASWLKRAVFDLLMPIGESVANSLLSGKPVPFWMKIKYLLGDLFLFRKIRERLGLRLVRFAYTGGAALGPEVYSFFHGIGLDLRQIYGQTEVGGVCCIQPPGEADPETTGKPLPDIEIKLSETDEVLVRSPHFLGYFNDDTATKEAISDGWLKTGDQGYFNANGHLVVIDRQKDIIQLENGYRFSPQLVENRLKFSPYIKEAVVVGQSKPYVAALIQIDMENVGNWAQRKRIPYTTFQDLASKPQVIEMIGQSVERVNQKLPETGRIQRYELLKKELDADSSEVTRTRKLRRSFVTDKYSAIIESLYL